MRKIALLLIALFFGTMFMLLFGSCESRQKSKADITVHTYKTPNSETEDDDDWVYYYVIQQMNGNYFYTSSPSLISNFSSVNWSTSSSMPKEISENPETQELETQEVEVSELSEDMQTEIDSTPEDFEGMTADELGDYEGGDYSDTDSGMDSDGGFDSGGDSGGDGGGGGE